MSIEPIDNLERHSAVVGVLRLFTVPLLNRIPSRMLTRLMRTTSHDAAAVVQHGGSTRALEAMYTRYHHRPFSRGIVQGLADYFWHHVISQPKALRNRLKIVEALIEAEIRNRLGTDTAIEILNVAGGSSRAIIHTLSRLKRTPQPLPVKVTSIDRDPRAIALGKELAHRHGCETHFQWVEGHTRDLARLVGDKSFDVVEVVGLLDYFSDERALMLLSTLRRCTKTDGVLITANIMPNNERPFIHKTGWPAMYYRLADTLVSLIHTAGYKGECEALTEPLQVHTVVRACAT